jgi:hypothetical protein
MLLGELEIRLVKSKSMIKGEIEMKTILRFSLFVVILAALLLWTIPVSAGSKTTFTYTETVLGIDPGEWTFLPSGNIHVRGMAVFTSNVSSDPRMTGNCVVVFNGNYDADGNGPMQGTTHFVSDEGGVWDGSWEGQAIGFGPVSFHGKATGSGIYSGLTMWFEIVDGQNTATILEH